MSGLVPAVIHFLDGLPLRLEKRWYGSVRCDRSHPKIPIMCLALVVAVTIVLPLCATGTMSFEEARGICQKRRLALFVEMEEEGEFDDIATHHLLYLQHFMNCLAAITSLCGYATWLFASPHTLRAEAERLDRTRMFIFVHPFNHLPLCPRRVAFSQFVLFPIFPLCV